MPSRQNPYYTENLTRGTISDVYRGMQNIMQPSGGRSGADLYNTVRAIGESDKVLALREDPQAIAQLFLRGADLTPEELAPLVARGLQEMSIREIDPVKLGTLIGQGGYRGAIQQGDMDTAMGMMPLFGQMPNQNTALSTGRQDEMSARDAQEALTQALSVQGAKNQGAMDLAQFNVDNGIASPGGTPMDISPNESAQLRDALERRVKALGLNVSDRAMDALAARAGTEYQRTRNAQLAVVNTMEALADGNLDQFGLQSTTKRGFFGGEKTMIDMMQNDAPPPMPETPAPKQSAPRVSREDQQAALQQAREAIARGADREAVAQRLRENGIDPSLLSAPDLPAFNGL